MKRIIFEKEAEDILEKKGFKVLKRGMAKNPEEAKKIAKSIGYPVVLKNTLLLHKSDKGGVKLDVNEQDIDIKFKELKSNKVLVQKYEQGKEFLIGVKKDETFGHVIAFGIGGIYTEMLNDVSFRILPINKKDASEMLEDLKFKKIFSARGMLVNKNLIISNLLKMSDFIKNNKKIIELDINPLIITDKSAVVADARIVME